MMDDGWMNGALSGCIGIFNTTPHFTTFISHGFTFWLCLRRMINAGKEILEIGEPNVSLWI